MCLKIKICTYFLSYVRRLFSATALDNLIHSSFTEIIPVRAELDSSFLTLETAVGRQYQIKVCLITCSGAFFTVSHSLEQQVDFMDLSVTQFKNSTVSE